MAKTIPSSPTRLGNWHISVFGRYSDAERIFWRAVTICSKWFGQEHPSVAILLIDLGYLMEAQERWAEGEHVYRLAYAIRTVHLGASHHDSLAVARLIIRVMRAQGKCPPERELERLAKVAV